MNNFLENDSEDYGKVEADYRDNIIVENESQAINAIIAGIKFFIEQGIKQSRKAI
jgi:hypothetical protein